jgi:hypothetical protein
MNSSHIHFRSRGLRLLLSAVCLSLLTSAPVSAAKRTRTKRPITKLKFDPSAEKVELFAAMKKGLLETRLIPKDSKKGNILIENKTDKPLTVQFPESFVGVQVLKQYGGGLGGEGGEFGGQGGGGQGIGGGGGGGGFGGLGGASGIGGQGGGAGFFSIPPEKVVKIPYQSVCLEHGKREPSPRMTYRMVKVEQFTKDPALTELIRLVGMNRIHLPSAQAAAWHLSDKMSWRELASKSIKRLGGAPPRPYFSGVELFQAQKLVAIAVQRSSGKSKDEVTPRRTPTRRRRQRVR